MKIVTLLVGNYFCHSEVALNSAVELKTGLEPEYPDAISVLQNGTKIGVIANKLFDDEIGDEIFNNIRVASSVDDFSKLNWTVTRKVSRVNNVEAFLIVGENSRPARDELQTQYGKWNRTEAYKQLGMVVASQGYIGNGEIICVLGGVEKHPYKTDEKGNIPQWTWQDEADGRHKWGPVTRALHGAIAGAKANSGDKVSIRFNKGWIVTKL